MRIVSWNVNGIRAAEKKGLLAYAAGEAADLLLFQETKAHPDQLSPALRAPAGFHAEWCSAERKGYSGVATWCRGIAPDEVLRSLGGEERFDTEGRILATRFGRLVVYNISPTADRATNGSTTSSTSTRPRWNISRSSARWAAAW